jgi:hypothetical protein
LVEQEGQERRGGAEEAADGRGGCAEAQQGDESVGVLCSSAAGAIKRDREVEQREGCEAY